MMALKNDSHINWFCISCSFRAGCFPAKQRTCIYRKRNRFSRETTRITVKKTQQVEDGGGEEREEGE